MSAYLCLECERRGTPVLGSGDACWACKSTDLLRSGPRVDVVVFDLETDNNAEHVYFKATG